MRLSDHRSRGWVERMWRRWYRWTIRSRLAPVEMVAGMVMRRRDGASDPVLTNARSDATDTEIQWIKRLGRGDRNRERFRIYFHLGGLNLYTDGLATHTDL